VGCGILLIVYSRMDVLVAAFFVLAAIGLVVGAVNAAIGPALHAMSYPVPRSLNVYPLM